MQKPRRARGVSVKCPFCDEGMTFIGYDTENAPLALHTLPVCKVYADNDLVEFTIKVRRELEGN